MTEDTLYSDKGYSARTIRILSRIRSTVDYLFCLLYGLIGLEIVLDLAGARESTGFKQFLNYLTQPFLGPFAGIFTDPAFREHYRLRVSYMVALCVYLLLHLAVHGLIRLLKHNVRTSEYPF